jgi:hypothetical protein
MPLPYLNPGQGTFLHLVRLILQGAIKKTVRENPPESLAISQENIVKYDRAFKTKDSQILLQKEFNNHFQVRFSFKAKR